MQDADLCVPVAGRALGLQVAGAWKVLPRAHSARRQRESGHSGMSSDRGSRAVGLLACLMPTGRGPQLQGLLTVRLTPVSKCPCALASVRTRSVLTRRWAPCTCSLTWSHPPPPQCGSWAPPAGELQHPSVPPCSGTFHGVVIQAAWVCDVAGTSSAQAGPWLQPAQDAPGGGAGAKSLHIRLVEPPRPRAQPRWADSSPELRAWRGLGVTLGGRRPGAAPDPRDLEPSLPAHVQGPRYRRAASHPAAHEDPVNCPLPGLAWEVGAVS